MRFFLLFPAFFILSTSQAQNVALTSYPSVYIEGYIKDGANQKVSLVNQNLGGPGAPLAVTTTDSTGKFIFNTQIPFADYYYLQFANSQNLNVVLFGGDSIKLYLNAKNVVVNSNILGSKHSYLMNTFLREYFAFKAYEDSLRSALMANPQLQSSVEAFYQPRAEKFFIYRNNFISTNSNSPSLIVTLSAIDSEKEWEAYKKVAELLALSFPQSPSVQNLVAYVSQLQSERDVKLFLEPGRMAKDIALPNFQGDTLRLSDLKGKVVLLDFWASWCGPCRRENPNVVAMYKKYSADGFEVFSVSLDKAGDGAKWQAAILTDGLIWKYHVSDLAGWGCIAAKDYAVKGIPFTVLIDKEGKIIATNVRGADLQNRLQTIFGH